MDWKRRNKRGVYEDLNTKVLLLPASQSTPLVVGWWPDPPLAEASGWPVKSDLGWIFTGDEWTTFWTGKNSKNEEQEKTALLSIHVTCTIVFREAWFWQVDHQEKQQQDPHDVCKDKDSLSLSHDVCKDKDSLSLLSVAKIRFHFHSSLSRDCFPFTFLCCNLCCAKGEIKTWTTTALLKSKMYSVLISKTHTSTPIFLENILCSMKGWEENGWRSEKPIPLNAFCR